MRTQFNEKLDPQVFSIASNLFGFGDTETKKTIEKNLAIEKAITPNAMARIEAVYPAIIGSAFAQSMDNYRQHIAQYNAKVNAENVLIALHNEAVANYRATHELSLVQLEFSKVFLRSHATLKPVAYNEKTSGFCHQYGLLIAKKKIPTVKYASEIVFQNLLHLYNMQLMKRNEQYIQLAITTPRPLQEFKINSFLVTQLERKEQKSLAICSKTVRNHRQRLEEAGVFVDYHFAGQNRAVEVHINPKILVVYDLKTGKNVSLAEIDNQALSLEKGNLLPDNNENTRTFKNKEKIKENVDNISLVDLSSLSLPPFDFFTGTPTSKATGHTKGAGAVASLVATQISETLSEKWRDSLVHPQELAENLAQGQYHTYQPLDIRLLHQEVTSGTLTSEEFRELVVHDFFKSASKLWKDSTPYVGSWKKALNLYLANKWVTFTGNAFPKSLVVAEVQQLRWRLEWARKWFVKHQFTPLFPFDYFDTTRKTAQEVGFEYTKAKWDEKGQAKAKYQVLKRKQEKKAGLRKENSHHAKKCDNAIKQYLQHQITMPELFDFVAQNLPPAWTTQLPSRIEKEVLAQNQKTTS